MPTGLLLARTIVNDNREAEASLANPLIADRAKRASPALAEFVGRGPGAHAGGAVAAGHQNSPSFRVFGRSQADMHPIVGSPHPPWGSAHRASSAGFCSTADAWRVMAFDYRACENRNTRLRMTLVGHTEDGGATHDGSADH